MLIGVDHGNKQIKTVHCNPFVSGLQQSITKPFGQSLQYRGNYYTLSNERIPFRKDKTEDDRFFVLTLIAIAEELETRHIGKQELYNIQLPVGLPPAHFGAQAKKFTDYFGLPFNGFLHIFCKNSAKRIAYNTDATIKCVLENKVDILTHPGFRLDVDCAAIAAACAETGTYMELSSRHRIPDLKDLEASLKAGAKFVINSDAHKPVNVGKCDYAISLAEELGLTDNEIVNISDKPVVFRRGLTV